MIFTPPPLARELILAAEPGEVFTYYTGPTPLERPSNFEKMWELAMEGHVTLFQQLVKRGTNKEPSIYAYQAHRISEETTSKALGRHGGHA